MSKLRQFSKLICRCEKVTYAVPIAVNHERVKYLETRRTPKLKRTIIFPPLIVIVEIEIEAS